MDSQSAALERRVTVATDDELLAELADQYPVQAVGVDLAGDPTAVLRRLQNGVPSVSS